jgi:hypothetical protein
MGRILTTASKLIAAFGIPTTIEVSRSGTIVRVPGPTQRLHLDLDQISGKANEVD